MTGAEVVHDWPTFQDSVLAAGEIPTHPTAPGAYVFWLTLVVLVERNRCGCVACFDKVCPPL